VSPRRLGIVVVVIALLVVVSLILSAFFCIPWSMALPGEITQGHHSVPSTWDLSPLGTIAAREAQLPQEVAGPRSPCGAVRGDSMWSLSTMSFVRQF
jgi:hypothetical protein